MNKYFYYVLSAIFVMGLGMGIASCSDDDKNSTLITQLTDERKAPEDWEAKTFEPTIGSAVEGDPYTRVVATNTMESAAASFAELADNPPGFNETTIGFNYSIEGMGTLSYQRGSENGQYLAQVTVDLKQVPHLKKILYQTPEQSGNNSSFSGTAYYRFGDVVMDGEGYYWICVRPAFGKEGKQDSHWLCLSRTLPDKNLAPYKTSTGNQNYLPTGLGSSTKHMQNGAEMFYAMMHPDDWHNNLSGSPKTSTSGSVCARPGRIRISSAGCWASQRRNLTAASPMACISSTAATPGGGRPHGGVPCMRPPTRTEPARSRTCTTQPLPSRRRTCMTSSSMPRPEIR